MLACLCKIAYIQFLTNREEIYMKQVTYKEFVEFFGSPNEVAEYFDIKVQAVYQWKEEVPAQRVREYRLLKELRGAVCQ